MRGLIDTHFHLDHYRNHKDIYQYINQLEQYTLCMTNSPGVYVSCKNMYPETKYVKFAMGFHPLNSELNEHDLKNFLLMLPGVNYIGEIGLDFSRKKGLDRGFQERAFNRIICEASHENKVISVHVRNANDIAINILSEYRPSKCIIHWFQGTESEIKKYIELGCYFSINTHMVEHNLEIVRNIPTDRVLIESDGPYTKINNGRFTPQDLICGYEIIAKGLDDKDLVGKVFNNFKRILQK